MKKSTVVQIFLSSIVIAISLTIFFKYFGKEIDPIDKVVAKKETNEIAVMIDTFNPLNMTSATNDIDDKKYPSSWTKI